jgi:hypothetical protein
MSTGSRISDRILHLTDYLTVHVEYKGIMVVPPSSKLRVVQIDASLSKVLTGAEDAKTTSFGDHHWYSTPMSETSNPTLKWIEDAAWVGQGRVVVDERGSAVEYEIYQVVK